MKCHSERSVSEVKNLVAQFIRTRNLKKADAQLADAIALMSSALKAGVSLPQAIEMAATEIPEPLGSELSRAVTQMKLGRTVEEALEIFEERLPTEDAALFCQSVFVLRRAGGNLAQTFDTLAATIEERRRVEERIRVLTSQGIYQGAILLLMPWALAILLHIVSPEYLRPLFETRLGLALVLLGIALEVAGAVWIRKVVVIKV